MQLRNIKQGWKPVTLAVSMVAGGVMGAMADTDQFSNISTVINNHTTSKYIAEVNDPSEAYMSDKIRFNNLLQSWRKNTRFLSSTDDIINQKDFQAIVAMGEKAVPFIGAEIDTKASNLVWALNLIFNCRITDKPEMTITDVCKLWVKELRQRNWI